MPNLKFLIVEDDLFYQTYVNDLLAETGVDILNATDGEAGLDMAIAEKPDLIITDIEIPKIQGFVFFKKLREHPETKEIPVVMMSAKVEKALLEKHARLSLHAEGYLVKPFSGQVLIEMIRSVIGEDFGFSEVVIGPDQENSVDQPASSEVESAPEISQFPEEEPDTKEADRGITVLVVDDSRYICDVTRDFLEEADIETVTAGDGETGYKMACDLLPDLVLLDVQMPNMNGFVVCEMLRKQKETRNLPIILMSAVVDDESFQRHSKLRYHADAYLQKPFMKSELLELVRRFTSLGNGVSADVEAKTGFFVPPEDVNQSGGISGAAAPAVEPRVLEELKQAKAELKVMAERKSKLSAELDGVKLARDQMEAELFELRKTLDGNEGGFQDKLTLATQRFEEARTESERLAMENRALQSRLEEISSGDMAPHKLEELKKELKKTQEELSHRESENRSLSDKLLEAGSNLELKAQLTELGAKLQESSAMVLEMENRNKLLKEEVGKLRQGAIPDGGSADDSGQREALLKEIEALKRDLSAATEAKKEIEDQAKSLLGKRDKTPEADHIRQELDRTKVENQELAARVSQTEEKVRELEKVRSQLEKSQAETAELRKQLDSTSEDGNAELVTVRDKLSAALKRIQILEEEKDNLSSALWELEELRSRNAELGKLLEELRKENENSGKLAAKETQARMDLEGRLESQIDEKALLVAELEEARRQLDEGEASTARITDLESSLEGERKLRARTEEEIRDLKKGLESFGPEGDKIRQLEMDNRELRSVLKDTRKRCEQLEQRAGQTEVKGMGPGFETKGHDPNWDERLAQLENTLGETVREAQVILMEQKNRESGLEESVESLMRALEEERSAYRKEREAWSAREGELREAFEDALMESRRLMGEEAARLYPMHIPRRSRPLEVVTMKSRYGIAAAAALAALVLFSGGYFFRSKTGATSDQTVVPTQTQQAAPEPQITASNPPELWIGKSDTYEELWRRNTVQSVSEDMMIQATLHSRKELEAAIQYTATKEGWTRERTQKAMTDMAGTYNLSGSYYVTVYSKNLKGGYPGYADAFERHIVLRDQSGREARAHLPGELEGSKFITSRVSAAGKEMNPVFLYEVGLTVAFRREELADKPEGLQLVLYDIGAVPMRVLTWDMSVIGSLSFNEPAPKTTTGS